MPTPSQALLDAEAEFPLSDSVASMPRDVVLNRLMDYLFARPKTCKHPLPIFVAQRAFALASWLQRGDLHGGMSASAIARAFSEKRGAQYVRRKQITALVEANGGVASHARSQRTATNCAQLSIALRGNHNRAGFSGNCH